MKRCFAERRKTLWNNLAPHFSREALAALAAASGLPATIRAEQLPPDSSSGCLPPRTGKGRKGSAAPPSAPKTRGLWYNAGSVIMEKGKTP